METNVPADHFNDGDSLNTGSVPARESYVLLIDITFFYAAIKSCYDAINGRIKKLQIQKILAAADWHEHHRDKETGRRVLSESEFIEHEHEKLTAIRLAQSNYDVVFAPKGIFKRGQKKFDVYLFRDTVILEADLKYIVSKNPDTIARRIKDGCDQASRIVIDINSAVDKKYLIQGLRSGVYKNNLLKEILLFYKNKFYRLPKSLIESKHIYDVIK